MVLPTSQQLKAKLTPEVREMEYAPRLGNLKSSLRSAYKLVRENSRKSHETKTEDITIAGQRKGYLNQEIWCIYLAQLGNRDRVQNFGPRGLDLVWLRPAC